MDDEGLARALTPDQVKRFATFLASLTPEQLRSRFDAKRMMKLEIYPEIWDRPEETDWPRTFLFDAYSELRDFVGRVARDGDAMVVCIS